jgi:hypothetical protein
MALSHRAVVIDDRKGDAVLDLAGVQLEDGRPVEITAPYLSLSTSSPERDRPGTCVAS